MTISESLFEQAQKFIPGGVNSPVRAFRSVDEVPRFIKKAFGSTIIDEDGRTYIDYVGSWGPMILGHNHPVIKEAVLRAVENGLSFGAATENEVKMAELICSINPSIEMIRMVNSGTEAVMSAIRLARGYTGREKILKFKGCYHGHCDSMLVKAGSGVMTSGFSDSKGVTQGCAKDTLTVQYNHFGEVEQMFEANYGQIAAVIIEPVAANMGVILPEENFLNRLRAICTENQTLLIFDEVITGFRMGLTGAQGYYNISPDITTFGKIIGGGMPVGAYGGRKEIMQMIAPLGAVYQAGTLSGNPIAMAAGLAQINYLKDHPEVYTHIRELTELFASEMKEILKNTKTNCTINHVASFCSIFFTPQQVTNYSSAKTSDIKRFSAYFKHMLNSGIYLAPSQFEAMFISNAHSKEDIKKTLSIAQDFFKHLF